MIVVDLPAVPDLRVVGVVRGLVGEAERALPKITEFGPSLLALGSPPTELEALREHFVAAPAEPIVPLGTNELAEARALARFGEVGVPHPAFIELLRWADGRNLPVRGVDPEEEVQAELFVANIGYVELVRRTLRERRAAREPPEAPDADTFALRWDGFLRPGKGSDRYALARDQFLVAQLHALRTAGSRLAVVVDRERVPRLLPLLAPGPT